MTGYDDLSNVVLKDSIEYLRDDEEPIKRSGKTRKLGLVMCRGPSILNIYPAEMSVGKVWPITQ